MNTIASDTGVDPTGREAEPLPWPTPEFAVGDTNYSYVGPYDTGEKGDKEYAASIFASVDSSGRRREFVVYTSRSEGGARVSPFRISGAWFKGEDPRHQYTQDTQLHPAFAAQALPIMASVVRPTDEVRAAKFDTAVRAVTESFTGRTQDFDHMREVSQDFRGTEYVPLGNEHFGRLLLLVPAGEYSSKDLLNITSQFNETQAWESYQRIIANLNNGLVEEGLIPNFKGKPAEKKAFNHGILGPCTTEVFRLKHGDNVYEWHMARSNDGKHVWVDRIRLANAQSTAYGTDKQIVISGLLTSKPLEYRHQALGIPESLKVQRGEYDEIQGLLDLLEPVRQYKAAKEVGFTKRVMGRVAARFKR